jgi:hypothetical protein
MSSRERKGKECYKIEIGIDLAPAVAYDHRDRNWVSWAACYRLSTKRKTKN